MIVTAIDLSHGLEGILNSLMTRKGRRWDGHLSRRFWFL